jgi:hypothetical protein
MAYTVAAQLNPLTIPLPLPDTNAIHARIRVHVETSGQFDTAKYFLLCEAAALIEKANHMLAAYNKLQAAENKKP